MKIADSRVQMNAQWSAVKYQSANETIQFWTQEQNQITNDNILIDISDEGKALQQNSQISAANSPRNTLAVELTDKDKEKIRLIEHFIYVLTGKRIKFKVFDPEDFEDREISASGQNTLTPAGWGLKYDKYEYYHETESMSFSSSGSVVTEDGRTINFNLNFNVSREFMSYHHISIRAGDALLDPLVINFKNASASLGDRNYYFDIDCDGKNDLIAFTGMGSGFLALDRNNNGFVDDGSELFGPQSGNGFDELAAYDEDRNGWIDENDEIFDKLRIWTLDEEGNKTLLALGQVGVGAIYLGNIRSEYGLKTMGNDSLGQIRSTGVFLKENGEVGTIQHVDLAI